MEVTQKVGAGPHERSQERTGYCNGHRDRWRETRLGFSGMKIFRGKFGEVNWLVYVLTALFRLSIVFGRG